MVYGMLAIVEIGLLKVSDVESGTNQSCPVREVVAVQFGATLVMIETVRVLRRIYLKVIVVAMLWMFFVIVFQLFFLGYMSMS